MFWRSSRFSTILGGECYTARQAVSIEKVAILASCSRHQYKMNMGQQLRVRAKRKRRKAYLDRRKAKEKAALREPPDRRRGGSAPRPADGHLSASRPAIPDRGWTQCNLQLAGNAAFACPPV